MNKKLSIVVSTKNIQVTWALQMVLSSYLLESFEAIFSVDERGGYADSEWVATKQELGLIKLWKGKTLWPIKNGKFRPSRLSW